MLFGHFSFQGTGHLKLHEVVKQRRGNHKRSSFFRILSVSPASSSSLHSLPHFFPMSLSLPKISLAAFEIVPLA